MGATQIQKTPPRKRSPLVAVLLMASVPLLIAAVWFGWSHRRPADHGPGERRGGPAVEASAPELGELRERVRLLERQVLAMQAVLAQRGPVAMPRAEGRGAGAVPEGDVKPEEEIRKDMFQKFDELVVTDTADAAGRRSSEGTIRAELADALGGKARLVGISCAATFCRVTIEEDTSVSPPLEVAALSDKAPSLKQEAMFNYEEHGSLRRTIMYVARQGQTLPVAHQPLSSSLSGIDGPRGL